MAVREAGGAKHEGNSLTENDSNGSKTETDTASAGLSFWDDEVGRESGEAGGRLSAGLAQHAGVEQCPELQPRQQPLDFVPSADPPALNAAPGKPHQTSTHPSRMTTVVLTKRDVMVSSRTETPILYAHYQVPGVRQFFLAVKIAMDERAKLQIINGLLSQHCFL